MHKQKKQASYTYTQNNINVYGAFKTQIIRKFLLKYQWEACTLPQSPKMIYLRIKHVPLFNITASQILYKLDPSVDPCQDFYRFTCGGFLSKNVVPDDELMKSTLQIIQEEVYTIVKSKRTSISYTIDQKKIFKMFIIATKN